MPPPPAAPRPGRARRTDRCPGAVPRRAPARAAAAAAAAASPLRSAHRAYVDPLGTRPTWRPHRRHPCAGTTCWGRVAANPAAKRANATRASGRAHCTSTPWRQRKRRAGTHQRDSRGMPNERARRPARARDADAAPNSMALQLWLASDPIQLFHNRGLACEYGRHPPRLWWCGRHLHHAATGEKARGMRATLLLLIAAGRLRGALFLSYRQWVSAVWTHRAVHGPFAGM